LGKGVIGKHIEFGVEKMTPEEMTFNEKLWGDMEKRRKEKKRRAQTRSIKNIETGT